MESPIRWKPAMATGVREIDRQHQELIDIINELDAAQGSGNIAHALDEALPRLVAYVLFHFGTEESLMAGLSGADEHAAQHVDAHRVFGERVAALREQARGEQGLREFVDYLKRWLLGHIMVTDRELGQMLAEPRH